MKELTFSYYLHRDSTVGVRIDDMFVRIASTSASSLNQCEAAGVLAWVKKTFVNDDVLLKLNNLQLVTQVCVVWHGLVKKANRLFLLLTN